MSRKSLPVVLTEAEIIRLEQWIRAGSTPQQVVLRSRIIVAAARGQTDLRITGDLRVQRRTVALWRQRVRELGIGCVWEMRPGRGRKTRYGAGKAAAIVEATLQTKPPGSTHWSTRKLAVTQGVSKNTIARVWQEHQLKPHLSKSFKLSRDPKFVEKLTDVVGVYLTPPQNAVVLCVDEKSQIQALDRTQPGLPLKPGRCGTFTHDYERHGTTTLLSAPPPSGVPEVSTPPR
jgi:transposase